MVPVGPGADVFGVDRRGGSLGGPSRSSWRWACRTSRRPVPEVDKGQAANPVHNGCSTCRPGRPRQRRGPRRPFPGTPACTRRKLVRYGWSSLPGQCGASEAAEKTEIKCLPIEALGHHRCLAGMFPAAQAAGAAQPPDLCLLVIPRPVGGRGQLCARSQRRASSAAFTQSAKTSSDVMAPGRSTDAVRGQYAPSRAKTGSLAHLPWPPGPVTRASSAGKRCPACPHTHAADDVTIPRPLGGENDRGRKVSLPQASLAMPDCRA